MLKCRRKEKWDKTKGESGMETYKTVLKEVRIRDEVYCDCCGRKIDAEREDYLHLEKQWGYFSQKDGENHVLDICEACYDKWRSSFAGAK